MSNRVLTLIAACSMSLGVGQAAYAVDDDTVDIQAEQVELENNTTSPMDRQTTGTEPVTEVKTFKEVDRNKDGWINKDEAEGLAKSFEDYDLNTDGRVSRREFEEWKTNAKEESKHGA